MDKRVAKNLDRTLQIFQAAAPGAWLSVRTIAEMLGRSHHNSSIRRHLKMLVEMGVLDVKKTFHRGQHKKSGLLQYCWLGKYYDMETGEVIDPKVREKRMKINGVVYEAA